MHTALGLLGIVVFVACTVTFAAAVTWTVVKLTPTGKSKPEQQS